MTSSSQEALDRKHSALRQAMGPVIAAALAEASVVEVMVNPDGAIWVERIGQGRVFSGERMAPADAERILRLVADHVGEVVTRDQPLVSATLPRSGERFQGVFMPVSTAPAFTIRKRPEVIFTLDDYVKTGVMTDAQAQALRAAAKGRDNILIAGGTGSGKTTLANAVLAEPAFAGDRVFLIEDTPELQCSAWDVVAVLTRRAPVVIGVVDLVRDALRMRPDRIVVGEMRDGAAALETLKSWNTGHPGGLSTIHANSAGDVLRRVEDLLTEVVAQPPRRAIAQAVDRIVHIRRTTQGRRVEAVLAVEGLEADRYLLTPLA